MLEIIYSNNIKFKINIVRATAVVVYPIKKETKLNIYRVLDRYSFTLRYAVVKIKARSCRV
jgi:hypothetical protein